MRRLTPWERLEAQLPEGFELRRVALVLALAFATGIAYAVALSRSAPQPSGYDALDAQALAREVARLEADLGARSHESEEQIAELARLRAQLAALEATAPVGSGPPAPAPTVPEPPREAIARPIPAPPPEVPGLDGAALLASGLDPGEADLVREAWLRAESGRREIEARARAEGWANSYRHARELRDIDDRLRRELDERGYDGLLYATGRPNRLVVQEVMRGSPAQRAGLRPGDRILRYDGERVFSSAELHAASLDRKGEGTVQLEVERDGSRVSLEVPRRPLGVLANLTRAEPER